MLGLRTFAGISRNHNGHATTNVDSVRAAATTGPRTGPRRGPRGDPGRHSMLAPNPPPGICPGDHQGVFALGSTGSARTENQPDFRTQLRRIRTAEPPEGLLARKASIWPSAVEAARMHDSSPRTVIHSDVHLGNWYVTGDGRMGLSDWARVCRGFWGRDLAYALMTVLAIEDRRAWERGAHRTVLRHRLGALRNGAGRRRRLGRLSGAGMPGVADVDADPMPAADAAGHAAGSDVARDDQANHHRHARSRRAVRGVTDGGARMDDTLTSATKSMPIALPSVTASKRTAPPFSSLRRRWRTWPSEISSRRATSRLLSRPSCCRTAMMASSVPSILMTLTPAARSPSCPGRPSLAQSARRIYDTILYNAPDGERLPDADHHPGPPTAARQPRPDTLGPVRRDTVLDLGDLVEDRIDASRSFAETCITGRVQAHAGRERPCLTQRR